MAGLDVSFCISAVGVVRSVAGSWRTYIRPGSINAGGITLGPSSASAANTPSSVLRARRVGPGIPGNPGNTDDLLNELLQRQTPFPADMQEIVGALRGASHEAMFLIDNRNRVIAMVRGSIHEVELPLEIQRAMRRRLSVHPHPSGGGPSIEDIVGGIGRGDQRQIIVTQGGSYEVDFGSISRLPMSQRDRIAVQVQRQIDGIMSDGRYVRWSQDDLLDYAIGQAAQEHGFTVTFTRRGQ
jgi:hypothetical protein